MCEGSGVDNAADQSRSKGSKSPGDEVCVSISVTRRRSVGVLHAYKSREVEWLTGCAGATELLLKKECCSLIDEADDEDIPNVVDVANCERLAARLSLAIICPLSRLETTNIDFATSDCSTGLRASGGLVL